MIKPKLSKLVVLALMLLAFYGCTTKNEIPQPVVDTQHVDALRTQLLALQQQVLGAQAASAEDSLNATLTAAQVAGKIAELQAYLAKTVSYTVTVGSFAFQPLSGATVKLTQGGKIVSATTANDGTATFSNLYSGIITATVDLGGFARLVYRADLRNTWDGATAYSTASTVLMLPTGGTAQSDAVMTTQYWKLWANYDMRDDTLGGIYWWGGNSTRDNTTTPKAKLGPDPSLPYVKYDSVYTQPVVAYLNQYSFWNNRQNNITIPVGFTGWDADGSNVNPGQFATNQYGNGQVISVAYENAKWTATVVNGVYTIKLPSTDVTNPSWSTPTNENSIAFQLDFGEFTANFTQYNDGSGAYITNNSNPLKPSYSSPYQYRMTYYNNGGNWNPAWATPVGGIQWSSNQTTTLTAAWPFFYTQYLK